MRERITWTSPQPSAKLNGVRTTTLNADQIKAAAMRLNPLDCESLAEQLLLSISKDDSREIDAAWLAEAKRRDERFAAGKSRTRPLKQVPKT
jgi:hypothetical protein